MGGIAFVPNFVAWWFKRKCGEYLDIRERSNERLNLSRKVECSRKCERQGIEEWSRLAPFFMLLLWLVFVLSNGGGSFKSCDIHNIGFYYYFIICRFFNDLWPLLWVEPGYNDIVLCDTSSVASDIAVPINSSLLTITLHSSVMTTQNIQSLLLRHNRVRV
jgi:hypothetical protein